MCALTVLQAPRASLVCRVSKGTKVSRESQGEMAQKGQRETLGPEASPGPQEWRGHRAAEESVAQAARRDRRASRAIPEFQVSWGPQGALGHLELMESQEQLGHQEPKAPRGKKVLLAPQARLGHPEPQ